jgi:hypothetical protein
MTRRQEKQLLLGELILFGLAMPDPNELMDPELRKLDTILDDEELLDAVVERLRRRHPQSHRRGRKSTPADVVLRLLVLKHLRNWSFERLEWEVTGNVAYRQFCRIGCGKVPDSTTMVRYGMLLDESVLQSIFDRLLQKARERKVTRGVKSAPALQSQHSSFGCGPRTGGVHKRLALSRPPHGATPRQVSSVAGAYPRCEAALSHNRVESTSGECDAR